MRLYAQESVSGDKMQFTKWLFSGLKGTRQVLTRWKERHALTKWLLAQTWLFHWQQTSLSYILLFTYETRHKTMGEELSLKCPLKKERLWTKLFWGTGRILFYKLQWKVWVLTVFSLQTFTKAMEGEFTIESRKLSHILPVKFEQWVWLWLPLLLSGAKAKAQHLFGRTKGKGKWIFNDDFSCTL